MYPSRSTWPDGLQLICHLTVNRTERLYLGTLSPDSNCVCCSHLLTIQPSVFCLEVCCGAPFNNHYHEVGIHPREVRIAKEVVELLDDEVYNPYRGSMNCNLIQNKLRDSGMIPPCVADTLLRTTGCFRDFIHRHRHLFVELAGKNELRIARPHMLHSCDAADDLRRTSLMRAEERFHHRLRTHIERWGDITHREMVKMMLDTDDFDLFVWPSTNILIRFLQRYPNIFELRGDAEHSMFITLRKETGTLFSFH